MGVVLPHSNAIFDLPRDQVRGRGRGGGDSDDIREPRPARLAELGEDPGAERAAEPAAFDEESCVESAAQKPSFRTSINQASSAAIACAGGASGKQLVSRLASNRAKARVASPMKAC